LAPASGARQWVLDQLDVEAGSDDPTPIMASDRLKQWNDEFGALELSPVHIETKFFRQFILLRVRPNDLGNVAPAAIELATRVRVGLLFYENL
jgi:hypothetical protein